MPKPSTGPAVFALLSSLSSLAIAQCIPAPGAPVVIGQDSITGANAIGFAFPFNGATYTDIHLSDHGICFLSNGGVPAPPTALPLVYTPVAASLVANTAVLCPFWSDTIPLFGGSTTYRIDAQATLCTITWSDVVSYGSTTPLMTFQMKLHGNGQIEFLYGPNLTNASTFPAPADNAVIGVSSGAPATLPAASVLSTGPVTTDPTIFQAYLSANTFDMAGDSLLLIPMLPGWVVIHTPDGAGCARSEAYGSGCDGLILTCNDPVHSLNWDLTTSGINAVSPLAFTLFGLGRQTPPLPLSVFGVNSPGCEAHIVPLQVMLIGTVSSGTATVTLTMPAFPAFTGLKMVAQTMAQTTSFASGVATSNAVEGTMGN